MQEPGEPHALALALGTGGYRFFWNRIQAGPVFTFGYDHLHLSGYQETGDLQDRFDLLTVDQTEVDQMLLKVGGQTSYSLPVPWGVLSPRFRLGFAYRDILGRHDVAFRKTFGSSQTTLLDVTLPGHTSMEIGGGLATVLPYDWQLWVDYNAYLFETATRRGTLTVGIRKDF